MELFVFSILKLSQIYALFSSVTRLNELNGFIRLIEKCPKTHQLLRLTISVFVVNYFIGAKIIMYKQIDSSQYSTQEGKKVRRK